MSIRASRKPLLALGAVTCVGGLLALVMFGFLALSNWAERDLNAYPFKDEDWLRYLLPSRFAETEKKRIMLVGPSTIRENLRYEQFEKAFPEHVVVQGGISLGTIEDVTIALEYVRKVYGEAALPDTMILGISPRFIAGIPETRPFRLALDLYSPRFRVAESGSGFELVSKGNIDGMVSAIRFLGKKQPERFRIALFATFRHWLSQTPTALGAIDDLRRSELGVLLNRARGFNRPPSSNFMDKLAHRISPYKYSRFKPVDPDILYQRLNEPASSSWWELVFTWNAAMDRSAQLRFEELLDFANRTGIRLMIINLPERKIARDLYRSEYRDYLDLVSRAVGDTPFVDLREFLATDEFYDAEHSTVDGSRRLTAQVIELVRPMIDME